VHHSAVAAGVPERNWRAAQMMVDALVRSGIDRAVVSPGSRSTPLTLALARHPGMRVWLQHDERSAAFFALGLAKGDGRPVVLVCTSGSAVANWHPAVMEADQGAVPLVLLSTDRPPELHDRCANQTIDQTRAFGQAVRAVHDLPPPDDDSLATLPSTMARLAAAARWPLPGPVHLNVRFREPLLPAALPAGPLPEDQGGISGPPLTPRVWPGRVAPVAAVVDELAAVLAGRRGLIVAGPGPYPAGFTPAVGRLAAALGWPLLADPLSGLRRDERTADMVIARYDALLRRRAFADACEPEVILRFGTPPVSKVLNQFLAARPYCRQVVVEAAGRWPDPQAIAHDMVRADPALLCAALADRAPAPASAEWMRRFQAEDRRAAALLAVPGGPALTETDAVARLLAGLPEDALFYAGNSMSVRHVDTVLGAAPRRLRVAGSRGVSGIDGAVSTVCGLAADCAGPVAGLLGDTTFGHDSNGLAAWRCGRPLLVVLNNAGGGIFGYLPQARLPEFETYWLAAPAASIAHLCRAHDVPHRRVDSLAALDAALAAAWTDGWRGVVEIVVDRAVSQARLTAYWAAVAQE